MAQLFQLIDIPYYRTLITLDYLVETGTGDGETISHVADMDFKLIQSCEIEPLQHRKLVERFSRPNIRIWNGDSTTTLPLMLNELDGPALIYLDAHFPGTGYVRNEFKSDLYTLEQTLPLEKELNIIANWQYGVDSIIVVDDLRIYVPGNYEGGDWPEREQIFGNLNSDFLYHTLERTHTYQTVMRHQGAIIYLPKYLS